MKNYLNLETIVSKVNKFFIGATFVAGMTISSLAQQPVITACSVINPPTGAITNQGYFVKDSGTEKRVYKDGHHFLSILTEDGIFALRPHTGQDVDGWGSTLYLQPQLDGATLKHTEFIQCNVVTNAGVPQVEINASGKVSKGINDTYGNWSTLLKAIYDSTNKTMSAIGNYNIVLPNTNISSDLYFFKLASNMMLDVPRDDGSIGDTGDASQIEYYGDGFIPSIGPIQELWFPRDGSHFPNNLNNRVLSVHAWGNYNDIDTVRQHKSLKAISPAYKPGLSVLLEPINTTMNVSFGIGYAAGLSQDFAADNVAVTPWIDKDHVVTNYSFNTTIQSEALSEDEYFSECNIESRGEVGTEQGIYFKSSMDKEYERVGSLDRVNSNFTGKVKVNTTTGLIKVVKE